MQTCIDMSFVLLKWDNPWSLRWNKIGTQKFYRRIQRTLLPDLKKWKRSAEGKIIHSHRGQDRRNLDTK